MVKIAKAGHEWLVCGDLIPDEGVFLSRNWGFGSDAHARQRPTGWGPVT